MKNERVQYYNKVLLVMGMSDKIYKSNINKQA